MPSSFDAASAAALVPWPPPATSTCTSSPNCVAAVSALLVASLRTSCSCSAINSVVILENPGFVLQLGDEFGDVLHLDAALAAWRFRGLEDLQMRRQVDAIVSGILVGNRLLF